MAKFVINKGYTGSKTVEADFYQQEGDFFVFYTGEIKRRNVVFTYAAKNASSIETEKAE
ncbi:MAG: hypothetical protein JWM23_558 [Microbacteriaceae bacterium]|nr:hypothetical protein [Microbacteriaceae bacterium]